MFYVKNSCKSDSNSGVSSETQAEESDDEEEWDDGDGLALEECLFCSDIAASLDSNVVHMYKSHGFFIPDAEYCADVQGLVSYLGKLF